MDRLELVLLLGLFAYALVVSWLLTACHIRVARNLGLLDIPNDRKFHKQPTPTGAGLVLYITLTLVTDAHSALWTAQFVFGGMIVIVGLEDDIRPLPAQLRLVVHSLIV